MADGSGATRRCSSCARALAPSDFSPRVKACKLCNSARTSRVFRERLASGLCGTCGGPGRTDRATCDSCTQKAIVRSARRRTQRVAAGLCPCGQLTDPQHKSCLKCRARSLANERATFKQKVAIGICPSCSQPRDGIGAYCSVCKMAQREFVRSLKSRGICTSCTNSQATLGMACEPCWFKNLARRHHMPIAMATELRVLFEKQGGLCAMSGVAMTRGETNHLSGASLDHKRPRSAGGTNEIANLRFVTYAVNRARSNLSDADFVEMCRQVVETTQ